MERLELRIQRLRVTFRFTFAFHAREVRFERDSGDGWERIFPETFSFHLDRHDPAELFIQLEDLLRRPRLIAPDANRRDAQDLVTRLLSHSPRYLERLSTRLDDEGRLDARARVRVHQDLALLAQTLLRFLESHDFGEQRPLRMGYYLLRKLVYRSLLVLLESRVGAEYLAGYISALVDPVDASDDPSESGFYHALEEGDEDAVNRMVVRMAERNFYVWLEHTCLDEENQAFEKEDSPFADRESEVLQAITANGSGELLRGADLAPFLRRPSRDCLRILKKLEGWFLRQYDTYHAAAMIGHLAALERGDDDGQRVLSRHSARSYAIGLALLAAPFLGAIFAYDRAPLFFDLACAAEVVSVNAVAAWYLIYRFCWLRDLTFFHAAVPRIGAGIIVGYLPVFLLDEMWGLASRGVAVISTLATLLGLATLLYIYVEVQRRLGGSTVAFARARSIFLLGVFESLALGVVMTSLVGRFMVTRNWSAEGDEIPVEELRFGLEPLLGQLPQVLGVEPFYSFPAALLMMTFLSFFIGIFLQLMWEELPITEPL